MSTIELDGLDFGTLDTVDILGTDIELFRAGSGTPLLFLHGIDGLEGSAQGLRELAKSFSVYAPSHPGFGASERPAGMSRVDDMGYFYLDMLNALGLDAPIIVGTSFGAWVACEMLTKEPGRARSLVLASPLGLKTAERREHWVADLFMISKQELGARLQVGPADEQSMPEMSEARLRRVLRNDEALSLYGWSPYMCNPKLGDRLHRISCPAMIVWGDKDAMIEPEYRARWRDALPQAQVKLLSGAGHRSHADKPAELATLIGQFTKGAAK
ncbi:alpha/beta fold hydrolase [Sphingobium nicotianae]|uniref:Alpha/beta hydrolase n=1 Tax=Sphingobium nicotianae TaxID=2782607 RepID=A0A9X1IPW4_9SPHN|nr:alpha/beta hydrolase [Sphingobium nicotianae]MBT2186327.1 alpha/beta hydrolase [Sphingobium nicotianae]